MMTRITFLIDAAIRFLTALALGVLAFLILAWCLGVIQFAVSLHK